MPQIGTREHLRQWLQAMMGMTYTRYSHLATPDKLVIMKKYFSKGKNHESGQSNQTQEGTQDALPAV